MERLITPPRRGTSPIWGPPPPCEQALRDICEFSCEDEEDEHLVSELRSQGFSSFKDGQEREGQGQHGKEGPDARIASLVPDLYDRYVLADSELAQKLRSVPLSLSCPLLFVRYYSLFHRAVFRLLPYMIGFKKFASIFHPIRGKTKINRDSLARVFPRFVSATCNYFKF